MKDGRKVQRFNIIEIYTEQVIFGLLASCLKYVKLNYLELQKNHQPCPSRPNTQKIQSMKIIYRNFFFRKPKSTVTINNKTKHN